MKDKVDKGEQRKRRKIADGDQMQGQMEVLAGLQARGRRHSSSQAESLLRAPSKSLDGGLRNQSKRLHAKGNFASKTTEQNRGSNALSQKISPNIIVMSFINSVAPQCLQL